MDNIYLIISSDTFKIKEEINKIIKKNSGSEVIKYSIIETPVSTIIEELDTYNFLSSKKIVIAEDVYFLTSESIKEKVEHDLDRFKKYIENPSSENILILTVSKLDERKTLVKEIKKHAKIIEAECNIFDIGNKNKEDYKIDTRTINYLVEYSNNDNYKVMNELEKLKMYKYDEKEINIDDIDNFVIRSVDDNIFTLVDAIVNKDKKNAFLIYEDLILKGEEPIKILISLANKFRLLYQVKLLSKDGLTNEEIGKTIGSHPYPVKLARNIIGKYKEEDLINIIYRLASLDVDIKRGNVYQNIGFETLILSL